MNEVTHVRTTENSQRLSKQLHVLLLEVATLFTPLRPGNEYSRWRKWRITKIQNDERFLEEKIVSSLDLSVAGASS